MNQICILWKISKKTKAPIIVDFGKWSVLAALHLDGTAIQRDGKMISCSRHRRPSVKIFGLDRSYRLKIELFVIVHFLWVLWPDGFDKVKIKWLCAMSHVSVPVFLPISEDFRFDRYIRNFLWKIIRVSHDFVPIYLCIC